MKILIDLTKFRIPMNGSCDHSPPEGLFYSEKNMNGLKAIRELAAFHIACRKCTDAPCIAVCPADAMEKDAAGVVTRHTNLCVSCKSCVTACPFGTLMTDFFSHHRAKQDFYDLTDPSELKRFIAASPEGAVTEVDIEADPEQHIYQLNDKILIKDYNWDVEYLN